jgi:hypothetical protein
MPLVPNQHNEKNALANIIVGPVLHRFSLCPHVPRKKTGIPPRRRCTDEAALAMRLPMFSDMWIVAKASATFSEPL